MSRLLQRADSLERCANACNSFNDARSKSVADAGKSFDFDRRVMMALHDILQLKPRNCHIWNKDKYRSEMIPVIDARDIQAALRRHGVELDET